MRARLHRFLLLFLMLALPLQAFASAAMLGCMAAHSPALQPMAMDDTSMAGCHESEPAQPPASHDCTHCAACALGSVLPIPSMDSVPHLEQSARFVSPPDTAYSGIVPDGPERPPRALPA